MTGLRRDVPLLRSCYTHAMTDSLDLTGRQFGDLVVLQRMGKRARNLGRSELWMCQCACGLTPILQREGLLAGSITSCSSCGHVSAVRREARRAVPDASTMRVCRRCKGEPQPLASFANNGSYCRRCVALNTAAWRARRKAKS